MWIFCIYNRVVLWMYKWYKNVWYIKSRRRRNSFKCMKLGQKFQNFCHWTWKVVNLISLWAALWVERKRKKALRIRNFVSSLKYLLLLLLFFVCLFFAGGFFSVWVWIWMFFLFFNLTLFLSRKKFNFNGKKKHNINQFARIGRFACCYLQLMLSVEFLNNSHLLNGGNIFINGKKVFNVGEKKKVSLKTMAFEVLFFVCCARVGRKS